MNRFRGRRVFTREAVKAMRKMMKDGKSSQDIAKEVGSTARSVEVRLNQLNIRKSDHRDGFLGAQVGVKCALVFITEARKRNVLVTQLVRDVLRRIATDNLFTAVLDD